jgi:hypothetical protein
VPALLNSANRARIEDFGRGGLVQVDCAACHHVALLTPDFLLRLGLSPRPKFSISNAGPVPRVRSEGTSCRFGQVEQVIEIGRGCKA